MADEVQRVGALIDDRYQIVEVMASGAMGSVYKAERVPVGKLVAVKFLHASYANDSEFQTRFERETRVSSKLAHPNCVAIIDFGVWEGAPYIVMEYVAGTTLRALIDRGPVPAPKALAIARQIAAGLAHAHEQDVIHRDIKPANVMITDEIGTGERVRILDFGLARLRGNVGRDATQSNLVVGTPNYMAPEQTVPGATVDARTDIYAVGVVLFEMISGEKPFTAQDTLQLLGMHRGAPVPRLADRAKPGTDLPVGLQELVDKAMAKSPGDRYQNAMELAAAIDDVIAGRADGVRASDPTMPSSPPTAIAPTMLLDTDASNVEVEDARPRRAGFAFGLVLLVGGIAGMAGYLVHRNLVNERRGEDAGSAGSAVAVVDHDAATTSTAAIDAATPATPIDAEVVPPDAAPPPIDAAVEAPPDAAVAPPLDAGGEPEIDPATAENPDPQAMGSGAPPEEEAHDAPQTPEQVATRVPEPPHLASTVGEAVQMIRAGRRDVALASLRALAKTQPGNANIPFLIGNLYFDQRWWQLAMDEYALAITKSGGAYRANGTLIRNVIRMLVSPKTAGKAASFLRKTIGHPALPHLKYAAQHDPSPTIKRQAGAIAKQIR
jgi:serine/threonine-protein kinase